MGDWDDTYKRAMDLYSSRLWTRETAMAAVGLNGPEFIAPRPADVDDWPPSERPEPEDLEAARLLGVDPRPPARSLNQQAHTTYWDEMGESTVETMNTLIEKMQKTMGDNNVPQPRYVIVHPDTLKGL